jgi:hypothetical protein
MCTHSREAGRSGLRKAVLQSQGSIEHMRSHGPEGRDMRQTYIYSVAIFILLVPFLAVSATAEEEGDDLRKVTKEEAKVLIYDKGVPIIDVRYNKNWKKSEQKIAGAIRENPNELGSWTKKYPKDEMIILYCD